MIDFRYHLVSIISIFLALAVGIVLGAGPLKGGIGTTLTQELQNARKDKAALNEEVIAAAKLQTASNAYGAATLDRVVAGSLDGRSVAVVAGPRAADAAVKGVTDAVTRAGGAVTRTVSLSASLLDPTDQTVRQGVLSRLATTTRTGELKEHDLAGAVLARGLAEGAEGAPSYAPATATTVMTQLGASRLVSGWDAQTATAPVPSLVVVVAGPLPSDPTEAKGRTDAYLGLVRGIDTVARGTMLVGDAGSARTPGSAAQVVSAARASNATAEVVSTVDDADLPMGQAAVALGLVREATGTAGRYGVLDDAQAVLPPRTADVTPAPRPTATPRPTASTSAPARPTGTSR